MSFLPLIIAAAVCLSFARFGSAERKPRKVYVHANRDRYPR